jgi:hypothetical protein
MNDFLNLPALKAQSDERDKRMNEDRVRKNLPEPEANADDCADDNGVRPSSDANSNHLENFKRLVSVAARKNPKELRHRAQKGE